MILIVCLLIQPLPTIPIKIVLNMSDRCWQHKHSNKRSCSQIKLEKKKRTTAHSCAVFLSYNSRDDDDALLDR